MTPEQLAEVKAQPATDALMQQIIKSVADVRDHDHPKPGDGEDWFCMNLTAWMGERMKSVLARLRDSEAEVERLAKELKAERHLRGLNIAQLQTAEAEVDAR